MKRRAVIQVMQKLFLALSLLTTAVFARNLVETDQGADVIAQTSVITQAAEITPPLHGMGLIPSPQHIEPPKYSRVARAAALPAAVDLSQWAVQPGYQGQVGSCTAWAVSYSLMGWYAKRLNITQTAFAPMYVYSQTNVSYMYSEYPQYVSGVCKGGKDCGAYIDDALKLVADQGVDTKADYIPQGDFNWWDQPTAAQHANAANYKIGQWQVLFSYGASLDGQLAIQTALANAQPVVIGLTVRPGFEYLSPPNMLDTDATGYSSGNHAVLAIGYDQNGLLIQNSWGMDWGTGGFGRIAWNVVQKDVYEAYIVDQATFNQNAPVYTYYTVTAKAGAGGSISPTSVSVSLGKTTKFTVIPNKGYALASVTGCNGLLSGNTYTTGPISTDCAIIATFNSTNPTYTVKTVSAGLGGSISPVSASVPSGQNTQFTIILDSGYAISSVTGCNGSLSGTTYTTGPISADCTVTATFAQAIHTVTTSAGLGGTISPTSASVPAGQNTRFTITLDSGYAISSVTGCNGSLSGTTYTTGPISADCTVTATFAQVIYTVTTSAGLGGTISPTSASVPSGQNTRFAITLDSGYAISSVTGCNGSLSGTTYTTGPVAANCTVMATFTPAQIMTPQEITGDWYAAAHDGSGFNITQTDQGVLLFYYGWDSSGRRLWLISDIGPRQIRAGTAVTLNMNETNGGHFMTPALPGTLTPWGTLTMTFWVGGSMATANLIGKDGEVNLNMQKVAGMASAPVVTGDWYDPAYDGSGFNMLMAQQGLALFYYGWDNDGNRLWLISDVTPASIMPGSSVTLNMSVTNDGRFLTPAKPSTLSSWGTLQLDFSSCTRATGTLTSTDGNSIVTFNHLQMIVGVMDGPPGC
ncbi:MAG: hypothetical protein LBQ20_12060 [Rhodanobacter sp.]|jgi:C1A family cysteine protease|nr:hypothetical protein [Rhodanobacter sp.]